MLRIAQLEQIEQLVREATMLIESQRTDQSDFPERTEVWIRRLEGVLNNNRISTSGRLAGLRGMLLAAKQGANNGEFKFSGKVTRRKILNAVTADAINKSINIVEVAIHQDRTRISEAAGIALRLVSQANHENLIEASANDFEYSKYLYRKFITHESLAEGVSVIEGLVGKTDAIISIDRALDYLKS